MAAKRFTDEQEQQICDEYDAGMSSVKLAAKWGCGHAIIQRIYRRRGGKLRSISEARAGATVPSIWRFTPEQNSQIRAEYEAKVSPRKLAKKYGCSEGAITAAVVRAGGTLRNASESQRGIPKFQPRICTLDEAAFDCIETDPVAAYFAGLMYADGNIESGNREPGNGRGQRHFQLRFSIRDAGMLVAFRAFLGSSHKISTQKVEGGFSTDQSRSAILSIASDRLCESLARYGVLPLKSGVEVPPPSMLGNIDWWRGVVDGDGWVYFDGKDVPRVGLCGSRETCESFLAFVRSVTDTKVNIQRNASIWMAAVAHLHAIRVANALYRDCKIALPRKHVAAQRMIAIGQDKGIVPAYGDQ